MIHEFENNIVHMPWLPNEIERAQEIMAETRRTLEAEQRRSMQMFGGLCMTLSIVLVAGAFVWAVWL